MSKDKPAPKFQRPNPEGAKSKSKIVRVHGRLFKVVATVTKDGFTKVLCVTTGCEIASFNARDVKPAHSMDETNFNAQYQRHLRKLDADKIKHSKKNESRNSKA